MVKRFKQVILRDQYDRPYGDMRNGVDGNWVEYTDYEAIHTACGDLESLLDSIEAENKILREGMKGDYDLDAWLEWVKKMEMNNG